MLFAGDASAFGLYVSKRVDLGLWLISACEMECIRCAHDSAYVPDRPTPTSSIEPVRARGAVYGRCNRNARTMDVLCLLQQPPPQQHQKPSAAVRGIVSVCAVAAILI